MRAIFPSRWLSLVVLAALSAPAAAEESRITVLHTTDLHGSLTAYDYLADRDAPRGLVKLASMVRAVRAEGRPTLLLDCGDAIAGGGVETVFREGARGPSDPMIAAMNALGYDAMAVGNHEFDFGLDELERTRKEARFPWLAANVARADGGPAFGASLVRDLGGVKVGVVGLCTPAVPSLLDSSLWSGAVFRSPVEAANVEVQRLRTAEHCDVVLLLAHTGLERDASGNPRRGDTPDEHWGDRLATEVAGVDAVILGHSHATLVTRVRGRLVAQAGANGQSLGRIDLTLTRASAGEPWTVSASARNVAVADSTPADSAITALARPFHAASQAALYAGVATIPGDVVAPRGRLDDSAPWEIVHRAQLAASHADVSLAALFDPAIRIPRGEVTRRDVLKLYPFDNTLVVAELTGAELKDVLERSAEFFQTYTFEDGRPLIEPGRAGYNYDTAEGVDYDIDLTQPAGKRIVNLKYQGAPLDPARRLKVAMSSYRANGGGGFPAVARAPRVWRSKESVRALIETWLREDASARIAVTPNWRLLPDYAQKRERPLIDLLVRRGALPPANAVRIGPDRPARRGDLAYWLARAFDWREPRHSNSWTDVPDSLEPYLDALLKRKVLGEEAAGDEMQPFTEATTNLALNWCERAARAAGYALRSNADRASFRNSLVTGIGETGDALGLGAAGISRAEVLGMVANTRYPTVRVLETTDFHGAILSSATERGSRRPVGGSAVLAAWVEKLRAENPEGTVLIDGGDCFQGTMISNLQFGRPVVEQMNAMRYTASAIGNHEFDWSADTLERRVEAMRFAALGANMLLKKSSKMPRWVRSDTSVVRRGVDVGVLGLCYRYTPSVTLAKYVAHLRFEDDSIAAARIAPKLKKAGCEIVVGVGHVPAEADSLRHVRGGDLPRLARGVKGVDAWFGGHSHNQVLDEVNGVPLMIAGSHGQYVAVCDFVVDPIAGKVVERRTRLQATYADEVTPDSAMAARVVRWNAGVGPIAAEVLGRNDRPLTRNRNAESSLGDFVADAMRAAAGADLAMQNSGGLRADLAAGPITKGAIYEVMPFDNTLVTMELTGAEVRRVFEEGLRFGRIAQLSGMRIAFDMGKPELSRVVTLTLADGTPLDDRKTYKIVVNNFMATGGDNFDTLMKGRNVNDTGIVIRDTLEDYVAGLTKKGAALDVKLDGRIQRLGSTPPTREDR